MRRVKVAVPLPEAKRRALVAMFKFGTFVRASQVAHAIWPEAEFHAQGAGAAASRILTHLKKDGLVRWLAWDGDWGYELTSKGRIAGRNEVGAAKPGEEER